MAASAQQRVSRAEKIAAALVAVAVVVLVAFKTTLGISFFDDSFYVAVPLRLATGARLFTDEWSLQATGSLFAVPFTALWHSLFGVSGIILASRLFYVALAALAGWVMVRVLRPTFGLLVPVVAVSAVLLAPAYDTFAVSYNTMAQIAFSLCVVLVFSARRDDSRVAAACAGALAVVGCVSYPPLAIAALPTAAVSIWVLRKQRLWAWLLGGAGLTLGIAAVWLLVTVPLGDITRAVGVALGVGYSGEGTSITTADRLALTVRELKRIVQSRAWWPAMALSVLIARPFFGRRVQVWLATLLPLALAIPGALAITRGVPWSFGVPALSYLLVLTVSLLPFVVFTAARRDGVEADVGLLLVLAGSFSAIAVPLVLLTTSSGFIAGMPGVGATPFALVALLCWLSFIRQHGGARLIRIAIVVLLGVQMALLFSVSYKEDAPIALTRTITHGAAAGIRTTPSRAEDMAALERKFSAVADSDSGLLVITVPLVYVLTDARSVTYATWVGTGPQSGEVLKYFRRTGQTPDVVVLPPRLITTDVSPRPVDETDPLVAWVTENYVVAEKAGYLIMRRR